jgi:hypothetical protein
MTKYLYGASVQGIQSFIFETNKLKEIVGASELVEQICTTEFAKTIGIKADDKKSEAEKLKADKNVIMTAAGNIKYIFEEKDKDKMGYLVRNFPKHISNFAPGVTISQAVQPIDDEKGIKDAIDKLEKKLKTQRNKAQMPVDLGFMGVERARRTGKPAFGYDKKEKTEIDRGTYFKQEVESKRLIANFLGKKEKDIRKENIPKDIGKITGSDDGSWLAIVHADGNGFGNILQNLANEINSNEEAKEAFKTFSVKLEEATNEAAQVAFREVVDETWQNKIESSKDDTYPMRPVILGGDDLTVIIRADLAYNFTVEFLKQFEIQTEKHFADAGLNEYKVNKLTACAGIAYIKTNYPFHYGYDLAESLIGEAKKFSKSDKVKGEAEIAPSSLSFYKVQASFIEDLKDMKNRTHYAEQPDVRFDYGPYLLNKQNGHPHIGELNTLLKMLEKYKTDKSKGVSKLRQWISELYNDKSKADFMLNRIKAVNKDFAKDIQLEIYTGKPKNVYKDLIDLHTFNTLYHED